MGCRAGAVQPQTVRPTIPPFPAFADSPDGSDHVFNALSQPEFVGPNQPCGCPERQRRSCPRLHRPTGGPEPHHQFHLVETSPSRPEQKRRSRHQVLAHPGKRPASGVMDRDERRRRARAIRTGPEGAGPDRHSRDSCFRTNPSVTAATGETTAPEPCGDRYIGNTGDLLPVAGTLLSAIRATGAAGPRRALGGVGRCRVARAATK